MVTGVRSSWAMAALQKARSCAMPSRRRARLLKSCTSCAASCSALSSVLARADRSPSASWRRLMATESSEGRMRRDSRVATKMAISMATTRVSSTQASSTLEGIQPSETLAG